MQVDNEGVASLNYQTGDKQQWSSTGTVAPMVAANNVYIHNGRLGLSSHAGIHGNGAQRVRIENVEVLNLRLLRSLSCLQSHKLCMMS